MGQIATKGPQNNLFSNLAGGALNNAGVDKSKPAKRNSPLGQLYDTGTEYPSSQQLEQQRATKDAAHAANLAGGGLPPAFDVNRGDPNKRVAAKLNVQEPVAPAAPAAPAGPTPEQIAAQQAAQKAAAVAAQQAAFWAQHEAGQRMKANRG